MEHYRSTLATAAVAVFGLAVAARVLHPGNFEDQPRPARPIVAQVASAPAPVTAWVDPPFDLYLRPSTSEMAVLSPRMTAPLPAGMTMAPILPAEMAAAVDHPPTAEAHHRRKAAQRVVRLRQGASARARTATAVPLVARPAQSDPLDVSSRDLALSRDGEG